MLRYSKTQEEIAEVKRYMKSQKTDGYVSLNNLELYNNNLEMLIGADRSRHNLLIPAFSTFEVEIFVEGGGYLLRHNADIGYMKRDFSRGSTRDLPIELQPNRHYPLEHSLLPYLLYLQKEGKSAMIRIGE